MKRKHLLTLSLTILLSSCGAPISSSVPQASSSSGETSSEPSYSTKTSIESSSSEEESSSSSSSSSESSASSTSLSSKEESSVSSLSAIGDVRTACLNLTEPENAAGIRISEQTVTIKGVILTAQDSVKTTGDYGKSKRYKMVIADESGYVTLAADADLYNKAKDYVAMETTTYQISGKLSLWKGTPEVIVSSFTWTKESSPAIITKYKSFASKKTLSEIKNDIASLRLNPGGTHFDNMVCFDAEYVDELVQEVLLFGDDNQYIQVHGNSKISNSKTKGSSYRIYGVLGMYNYHPTIEYITSENIETTFTLKDASNKTATEQYATKYTKDSESHSSNYEKEFYEIHHFEGYVSSYFKDSKENIVLTDSSRTTSFTTYTAAIQGKALFVNNTSEKELWKGTDFSNSILYPYVNTATKISIDYYPYLLNSSNYWMVFCFLSK